MLYSKHLIIQKLINTKAHLGYRTAYSDFQPYLSGFRNEMSIINLEISLTYLRRACNVIRLIVASKGHFLFVNTNPEYNKLVQQTATQSKQSYINHKWIGGLLTNWNSMQIVQQHFDFLSKQVFSKQKTSFLNGAWSEARQEELFLKSYEKNSYGSKLPVLEEELRLKPEKELRYDTQELGLKQKKGKNKQKSIYHNMLLRSESGKQLKSAKTTSSLLQPFETKTVSTNQNISSSVKTKKRLKLKEQERNRMLGLELRVTLCSFPRFKQMQKCFEGISTTFENTLPDCIIVLNATQNYNVINEAAKLQIPVISLVDSNVSNKLHKNITYPIPTNENSLQFCYLFCNCVLKTILLEQNKR